MGSGAGGLLWARTTRAHSSMFDHCMCLIDHTQYHCWKLHTAIHFQNVQILQLSMCQLLRTGTGTRNLAHHGIVHHSECWIPSTDPESMFWDIVIGPVARMQIEQSVVFCFLLACPTGEATVDAQNRRRFEISTKPSFFNKIVSHICAFHFALELLKKHSLPFDYYDTSR